MASFIFNSALYDEATGAIDYDTNSFKVLLLTSSATPNQDTWTNRSHITNEVANGNGYTTDGKTATVSVGSVDTTNNRVDITLGGTSWTSATFTARYAIYYKTTGTAATDLLVAVNDFGSDKSPSAGTLTLNASTLRKANT